MEKCYALKGQSLENGLLFIFQVMATLFYSWQSQHDSAQATSTRVRAKEADLIWRVMFVLLCYSCIWEWVKANTFHSPLMSELNFVK